jgi:small subunit ribosomal protein S8
MPSSKLKVSLASLLEAEGYVSGHNVELVDNKPVLTVELKYFNGKPVIEMLKRISRPGLRIYKAANELPEVNAGLGVSIISTNKGLMTDRAARTAGIGGEVVCSVF